MKILTSEQEFNSFIDKSGIKIVDFYAEWCGPCKMLSSVFDHLSKKYPDIEFAKINVDDNPALAGQHGVMGIPSVFFYRNGLKKDQFTGMVQETEFETRIRNILE